MVPTKPIRTDNTNTRIHNVVQFSFIPIKCTLPSSGLRRWYISTLLQPWLNALPLLVYTATAHFSNVIPAADD